MLEGKITEIVEWAQNEENIRMVVLEGSLARNIKTDDLADIDINLFVKSYGEYLNKDSWISNFGEILVYIPEKFDFSENKRVFTRLVIYEDGTKVDFSFWSLDLLEDIISGSIPYYQNGHRVLVDKDCKGSFLPKPLSDVKAKFPTEDEYISRVKNFWFEVHYVAKFLKRGELWFAKFIDAGIKDSMLLQMMEWYASAVFDSKIDTSFKGRNIEKWLGDMWSEVKMTYSGVDIEQNWNALFKTFEIYRKIAMAVAQKLGYNYPIEIDRKMFNLVRKIYESKRG